MEESNNSFDAELRALRAEAHAYLTCAVKNSTHPNALEYSMCAMAVSGALEQFATQSRPTVVLVNGNKGRIFTNELVYGMSPGDAYESYMRLGVDHLGAEPTVVVYAYSEQLAIGMIPMREITDGVIETACCSIWPDLIRAHDDIDSAIETENIGRPVVVSTTPKRLIKISRLDVGVIDIAPAIDALIKSVSLGTNECIVAITAPFPGLKERTMVASIRSDDLILNQTDALYVDVIVQCNASNGGDARPNTTMHNHIAQIMRHTQKGFAVIPHVIVINHSPSSPSHYVVRTGSKEIPTMERIAMVKHWFGIHQCMASAQTINFNHMSDHLTLVKCATNQGLDQYVSKLMEIIPQVCKRRNAWMHAMAIGRKFVVGNVLLGLFDPIDVAREVADIEHSVGVHSQNSHRVLAICDALDPTKVGTNVTVDAVYDVFETLKLTSVVREHILRAITHIDSLPRWCCSMIINCGHVFATSLCRRAPEIEAIIRQVSAQCLTSGPLTKAGVITANTKISTMCLTLVKDLFACACADLGQPKRYRCDDPTGMNIIQQHRQVSSRLFAFIQQTNPFSGPLTDATDLTDPYVPCVCECTTAFCGSLLATLIAPNDVCGVTRKDVFWLTSVSTIALVTNRRKLEPKMMTLKGVLSNFDAVEIPGVVDRMSQSAADLLDVHRSINGARLTWIIDNGETAYSSDVCRMLHSTLSDGHDVICVAIDASCDAEAIERVKNLGCLPAVIGVQVVMATDAPHRTAYMLDLIRQTSLALGHTYVTVCSPIATRCHQISTQTQQPVDCSLGLARACLTKWWIATIWKACDSIIVLAKAMLKTMPENTSRSSALLCTIIHMFEEMDGDSPRFIIKQNKRIWTIVHIFDTLLEALLIYLDLRTGVIEDDAIVMARALVTSITRLIRVLHTGLVLCACDSKITMEQRIKLCPSQIISRCQHAPQNCAMFVMDTFNIDAWCYTRHTKAKALSHRLSVWDTIASKYDAIAPPQLSSNHEFDTMKLCTYVAVDTSEPINRPQQPLPSILQFFPFPGILIEPQ